MARNNLLYILLLALVAICSSQISCETIALSSILPKIEAIHEDAKSLLIKNVELKNKILAGYQAQNEAKIQSVKEGQPITSNASNGKMVAPPRQQQGIQNAEQAASIGMSKQQKMANFQAATAAAVAGGSSTPVSIDYSELEEFNKWVEVNLEYAVKNTQATAEALKDEAQANNGNVEYTEQAVKDGIEGVKYWQAAVIFQDKTLKNEKFESQLD